MVRFSSSGEGLPTSPDIHKGQTGRGYQMDKLEEVHESLSTIALILTSAADMVTFDQFEEAITTVMSAARLLNATGEALCVEVIKSHGYTLAQVESAMLAGRILTEMSDPVEAFPDITPEDFA